jgi:predicted TPR repeat methyltransferase
VTATSGDSLRGRLYKAYASQHSGCGDGEAAAIIYRRDIRPALLPPPAGAVLDIGCGQGQLVSLLLADGYDAEGVDVSPEQVAIAQALGLNRVSLGDYREFLDVRAGQLATVTATDFLEHLAKDEVLDTFDLVMKALVAGGVFIARVPNAASPFGGRMRHGDFTHESSYTARSVRQVGRAVGFASVDVLPCEPAPHGVVSSVRLAVWKSVSGFYKLALAAETGVVRGHIVTQNLTFVAQKAS